MSRRFCLVIFSVLFCAAITVADIGSEYWTQIVDGSYVGGGGNNGNDYGRKVAFDSEGNVVVAGSIDWVVDYSYSAHLIKYTSDGTFLWNGNVVGPKANPYDNNQGVGAHFNDVVIDSDNNITVPGQIAGRWPETYLWGFLVQKYNAAGGVIADKRWKESYGSAWQMFTAAAVDSDDNVYLTGHEFEGWSSNLEWQWITFKFDKFGFESTNRLWASPITFNYNTVFYLCDYSYDVAVDADGNVIIVGVKGISGADGSVTKDSDWHVRKYAADKTLLWEDTFSGTTSIATSLYDYPVGVVFDSNGDALVIGYTNKGTDNFTGLDYDWLMIKYDGDNGDRLWTQSYESAPGMNEICRDVVVDSDDNFYVGGNKRESSDLCHMRLVHIDGVSGATLEEQVWAGPNDSDILGLAIQDDRLAISGYINNGTDNDIITKVLVLEFAVEITSPENNLYYQQGDNITFAAEAAGGAEPYGYSWTSDIDGVIGTEQTFDISTLSAGSHTVMVVVEDDDSETTDLNVTVNIQTLPVISDIDDATTYNTSPYSGSAPEVQVGSGEISWSLIEGPAGMTIDEATGVVTWDEPDTALSPYTVTIQAENGVGSDMESWLLTVVEAVFMVSEIWEDSYDGGGGSNHVDSAYRAAFDSGGNVISCGYVDGPAGDGHSAHIVKYAPDKTVLWSETINAGSNNGDNDRFHEVAVDSQDNVIAVGMLSGNWTNYYVGSYYDAWLIRKYQPDGTLIWQKVWQSSGSSPWQEAYGVAIDEDDNIYVTGRDFGDWYSNESRWATIKYDPDGNVLLGPIYYNYSPSINYSDYAYDIDIDADGNFYVVGIRGQASGNYDWHVIKTHRLLL